MAPQLKGKAADKHAKAEDRWICAETPQKLALQLTEPIEVSLAIVP